MAAGSARDNCPYICSFLWKEQFLQNLLLKNIPEKQLGDVLSADVDHVMEELLQLRVDYRQVENWRGARQQYGQGIQIRFLKSSDLRNKLLI